MADPIPNPASNQIPLPLSGKDSASFDNFLVAAENENNAFICEALKKLAMKMDAPRPIPLFLAGSIGSGKTHLLSALVSQLQTLNPKGGVYLNLSLIPQKAEMLEAAFNAPFICIDNIDAWAGKTELEQALFAVVEAAKNNQRLLVVTAKTTPLHSDFALQDLVSRLSSGVVFTLQNIDDATKVAAVKLRAKNRGLMISDDAVSYLLSRYARDTHSLFAALKELDRASIVSKRKVTIPFIQEMLKA